MEFASHISAYASELSALISASPVQPATATTPAMASPPTNAVVAWLAPLVAAVGVAIAGVTFHFGQRREQFDNTIRFIEGLQSPEAVQNRFELRGLVAKANNAMHGYDSLTGEERAKLSSIASLFGLAGLAIKRRRANKSLFLDAWGSSVVKNFDGLAGFMTYRNAKHGPNSLWRYFEWLAVEAKQHLETPAPRPAFSNVEIASLAASCIAGGIALVLAPGAYDQFSIVISATLVAVIIGSLEESDRTFKQKLAIAAALSLSSLPASGLIWESIYSSDFVGYFLGAFEPVCLPDATNAESVGLNYYCVDEVPVSRVEPELQTLTWLALTGIWYFVFPTLTDAD